MASEGLIPPSRIRVMRNRAPIDRAALEPVLAPFGSSKSLPADAYTSAELFAWEREHFFSASWVCVGRTKDLCAAQGCSQVRVGDESFVLTGDGSGALGLFHNVCRHRGHELLAEGERREGRVLQCPYHSWVYGLDGSLWGAPHFSENDGFDRSDYPLVPVRMHEWNGWLFVNASGTAPEFDSYVGSLDSFVSPHRVEELVVAARHDYEIAANWKIVTENYHECYHCPTIHPELCKLSPPNSGFNFDPDGAWVGGRMEFETGAETMSLSGRSDVGAFPWLSDELRGQVLYIGLFPNLLISLHPDYVMTHRFEPLAPGRARIECLWLFAPEAVARDDFDPGYAVEFWDITNRQDWSACEGVQRGAGSRGYRQGPLSTREDAVYDFVTMVARGYLDGVAGRVVD
jgi:Rieske 2Fe-2S family protein